MGTDNLIHKRKARRAADLRRHKARREPYTKILIVCEGEKTEPHYFHGLKERYGLNSANVEIGGNASSAPSGIYDYARQRYREEKDARIRLIMSIAYSIMKYLGWLYPCKPGISDVFQ